MSNAAALISQNMNAVTSGVVRVVVVRGAWRVSVPRVT